MSSTNSSGRRPPRLRTASSRVAPAPTSKRPSFAKFALKRSRSSLSSSMKQMAGGFCFLNAFIDPLRAEKGCNQEMLGRGGGSSGRDQLGSSSDQEHDHNAGGEESSLWPL